MTDSEKLNELIEGVIDTIGTVRDLAEYLANQGVTVQRWIPVTERLPEKDGWYQVWTKTAQGGFKSFNKAAFYCGEWHGTGGRWGNVTHWMPLPEPPKEVE